MENIKERLAAVIDSTPITWEELNDLQNYIKEEVIIKTFDACKYGTDEFEKRIIASATEAIKAHREKKFKDALARYVAEQGVNT